MFYKGYKSKKILRKITWILNSVNLSLELLKDVKWKKIYSLLNKAQKYLDIKSVSKKDLKSISKDICNGNLSKRNINKIAKTWFNLEKKFNQAKKYSINLYIIPFLGKFFDKKQIILC